MPFRRSTRAATLSLAAVLVWVSVLTVGASRAFATPSMTNTAAPNISGTVTVGSKLTASPGTWTTTGATYAYQWAANGAPISGGTTSTYTPVADQVGETLTVQVTASKPGYADGVATSAATTAVKGPVHNRIAPTISGSAAVGSVLTGSPGTWQPSGTTFTYKWSANGTAISGATKTTYTPTTAVLGKTLTLTVTAAESGYTTESATSAPTAPVTGHVTNTAAPKISGTVKVGSTLTAAPGTWTPAGATFAYQWTANGAAISGANDNTYVPGAGSVGDTLTVRVTASKAGFSDGVATSAATTTVKGPLLATVAPSISGTPAVGATQTASPGTWQPTGATFTYKWLANGTAISGATKPTYVPTAAVQGETLQVQVTAAKSGYTTASATSTATSPIGPLAPLHIVTTAVPRGVVGVAYNQLLESSGGTDPIVWTVTGTLPAGLKLSSTGVISGTPTAAASSTVTITATDSATAKTKASESLTVSVVAFGISTTALNSSVQDSPFSQQLTAVGGTPPYSWSIKSGALPAGLTLSSTGLLSGTPTIAGDFSVTIAAADSSSPANTDSAGFTVDVAVDTTPPGAVTAVSASPILVSSATLHWTNPTDSDLSGVVVRRSQGLTPPASPTDGTAVGTAPATSTSITDSGLTAGTQYSYALFAFDRANNYALSATLTLTTHINTLVGGQGLSQGQELLSPNGAYAAIMQGDGNFVLYGPSGSTWSTGTSGSNLVLTMQSDGNLVVYSGGTSLWESGTAPGYGLFLTLQDDGNLVIYGPNNIAIWTNGSGRIGSEDTLAPGTDLPAGQSLYSTNGQYRATMQTDGNFVFYGPSGSIWASGTAGTGPNGRLSMQADGNLVVYTSSNVAEWNSATAPAYQLHLSVQSDGNLVIYGPNNIAVWSYSTGRLGSEDTLHAGETLNAGNSLYSLDGRYQAKMQVDGNFVVYGPGGSGWSSQTAGTGSQNHLSMQTDGQLVVYTSTGAAVWNSGTAPSSNDSLVMQNDGNLVIYGPTGPIWSNGSKLSGGGSRGDAIVTAARSQLGYTAEMNSCNVFSAYWQVSGSPCADGTRSNQWCADFAAWAWAQAGITGLYGNGINALSSSFRTWGQTNGRWHPLGDGYSPQPGDVAEYDDAHVGIYTGGPASSPTVISGNWDYPSPAGDVYEQANVTNNGDGANLTGYVSAPD